MPWTNQNGGGQPKGPWGQGPEPSSGGGMRPPDFETLLNKFAGDLRRYLPAGALGRNGLSVIGAVVVLGWLLSGFYTVTPQEQGVVLRFGAFIQHTGSGMHYHLPWPIETAYTPNVKENNQVNIGFKPGAESGQFDDVSDESYMLTGDENIVDMQFTVNWRIKDANSFLFNNQDFGKKAGDTVKAVAESAMRDIVGQDRIDLIVTSHREEIQLKVMHQMQQTLDSYVAGIEITGVKMQKAEPPSQVRDAYLDVQKALADQDRRRNEAEAYANAQIPKARGEAAGIVQEAEAYRQQAIAIATGEAQRFNAIYQEYKRAPEVTRRRLYLETMSQVLGPLNKVIVDDSAKGVMPYFQLPPLPKPPAERTRKPGAGETAPSPGEGGSP